MAINIVLGQCIQDLPPYIVEALRRHTDSLSDREIVQYGFEYYRRSKIRHTWVLQGLFACTYGLLAAIQALILALGTVVYVLLISGAQNLSSPVASIGLAALGCFGLMAAVLLGVHLYSYYAVISQKIRNQGFERELVQSTKLNSDDLALLQSLCLPQAREEVG